MKRILILGGFGFMGRNLNKVFTGSDYTLFNESRQTGCDILDISQLIAAIRRTNPQYIINAAAHVGSIHYVSEYPAEICSDNIQMYLNIFKAINTVDPSIILINPLSNCSYPWNIDIQEEALWWDGPLHESVDSYGIAKKMAFVLSECYRRQYGLRTVNLILPNAYGPFDYDNATKTHAMNGIILRMIKAVDDRDEEFVVWGTGTPVREWLYMEDAARVIKEVVDQNRLDLPNPLNIGQANGITINDSVSHIRKALGTDIPVVNDTSRKDGAPVKIMANGKFRMSFPDFVFTDYEEGIRNTIAYYKQALIQQ